MGLPFCSRVDNVRGMIKAIHKTATIAALSLLAVSAALAQDSYRPQAQAFENTTSTGPEVLDKKTSSIFRRPAKDTPAEQLAYAQALEAENRTKQAASQYNALVHRWHQSEEAPLAQFSFARILYERGSYERAFKEFQYVVQFFPGLFDYNEILDYQLRIANQIMGKRWGTFGIFHGFESPERALPLFETIIANAPNWSKTPAIGLTIAMIHENQKDYEKAAAAYESVVQAHPGSEEAQTAAFRKGTCLADESDKTTRDEQNCRNALSALASFVAAYPQSDKRAEAEARMETLKARLEEMYYRRARYYDKIEKRPVSALVSYREFMKRFPGSTRIPAILERIEVLERQQPPSTKENE